MAGGDEVAYFNFPTWVKVIGIFAVVALSIYGIVKAVLAICGQSSNAEEPRNVGGNTNSNIATDHESDSDDESNVNDDIYPIKVGLFQFPYIPPSSSRHTTNFHTRNHNNLSRTTGSTNASLTAFAQGQSNNAISYNRGKYGFPQHQEYIPRNQNNSNAEAQYSYIGLTGLTKTQLCNDRLSYHNGNKPYEVNDSYSNDRHAHPEHKEYFGIPRNRNI